MKLIRSILALALMNIGMASAAVIQEAEVDGVATNNTLLTAQTISPSAFTLPVPGSVFGPPNHPTATIQGSGGFDDVDLFRFFAYGGRLMVDMDNLNPSFDAMVALFDSTGTLLAFADDSGLDDGSAEIIDPFLGTFLLPGTGNYYLAVSENPNFPTTALSGSMVPLTRPDGMAGGFAITGVPQGVSSFDFNGVQPGSGSYTLHISVENTVPEPASLVLFGSGLIVAISLRRRFRQN